MLTGPYTVMDWSFIEYYPDRRTACLALAKELRKEVEALIEEGAKIIQIDEPATSVRPEELPVAIEAMHIVTDGLPAYFITHICYGAFENIYPGMLDLPVDNFDLEMSNSGLDMLELFKKAPLHQGHQFWRRGRPYSRGRRRARWSSSACAKPWRSFPKKPSGWTRTAD